MDSTKKKQPIVLAVHETPQDDAGALIARAIDKNVSVDVMERLLTIRRELKQEKAKEDYDRAMADFQLECPTIEKKVQGYNYKYADLTSIIEQVKELLSRHGFSYTFDTDDVENTIVVYCKVKHIGGHMEISKATITRETTTKMNASQQSGAAMTYGKRYAFINAFGILTGDEDTDAKSDHTQAKPVYYTPPVRKEEGLTYEKTDDAQVQEAQVADHYAGKSIGALKVEIAKLMQDGKIEKNFERLSGLTRDEAVQVLREATS